MSHSEFDRVIFTPVVVTSYDYRRDRIEQRNLELGECPLCGVLVEFGTMLWHPDPTHKAEQICIACHEKVVEDESDRVALGGPGAEMWGEPT